MVKVFQIVIIIQASNSSAYIANKQILLNVGLKFIVKLNFVGARFVFFYLIKELHTKAQHLGKATFLSALRALRPLRSPNIVGLPRLLLFLAQD